MKNIIRTVIVSIVMALSAAAAQAQNVGDRLFADGQKLQMTQTVKAQNLAIAKFRSAKKAYDSAAKKAMCDNQIAICQNNIKTISAKGKTVVRKKTTVVANADDREEEKPAEPEREPVRLSLSVSSLEFKAAGKKSDHHEVTVNCNYDDWTYTCPDWIEVVKNGNRLVLTASANDTEGERSGKVAVTCHGETAELMVYQKNKFSIKSIFGGKKSKK